MAPVDRLTVRLGPALLGLALAVACGGDTVVAPADGSTGSTDAVGSSSSMGLDGGSTDEGSSTAAADETGFSPAGECGNGILELGESCDDAKDGDNDEACTDLCAPPVCGDGFVQASRFEHCDGGREGTAECTAECTALQAPRWTVTLDSDIGHCLVNDLAIDEAGNVIAVGQVGTTAVGSDVWIAKLGPDGNELWSRTFTGDTINGSDGANGVALDGDQIVVAGSVQISGQSYDVWLGRFTADGEPVWTTVDDLVGDGSFESLDAVAVGEDGTIWVAGVQVAVSPALLYGAYSGAGVLGWTQTEDDPRTWDDAYSIHARGDSVVIAGTVGDDVWVRSIDSSGAENWTLTFDAIIDDLDTATGVWIDTEGSVYLVGSTDFIYVRKFDAAGREVWSRIYAENGFRAFDIALTDDAIYLAGADQVLGSGQVASLRRLTLDGDPVWIQLFDTGESLTGGTTVAARDTQVAFGGRIAQGLDGDLGFARSFAAP